MSDPYQRGSSEDWAKAEADELRHQLRRREGQLARERLLTLVVFALLAWITFKFLRSHALSELWQF